MNQKQRYWLFRRGSVYYLEDSATGEQKSLGTSNRQEAERIRAAKSEAEQRPQIGLALAKAYMAAYDPKLIERTWSMVMEEFCQTGKDSTRTRRQRALRTKPFVLIRTKKIIETTADDFRQVFATGGIFANHQLRCLQNLAVGLGWLPWPIIPPKLWPKPESKPKRAITSEEHQKIVKKERNAERRLYYELLWEIGASQTDAAQLTAESIDSESKLLIYQRKKTGETACMTIGRRLEALLRQLGVRCLPKHALELVVDLDAMGYLLHGLQEGRHFRADYNHCCYLPLYARVGDIPLWAQLRTSNQDAAAGVVAALKQIVRAIRQRCYDTSPVAGPRPEIYTWIWTRCSITPSMMNSDQDAQVWKRLTEGKSLDGLGLDSRNGRLDLSGLLAPEPSVVKSVRKTVADVSELNDVTVFKGVTWKSLDFSSSRLNGLRFFNCTITDCVLDECRCQDWRLWGTTISNTSFRSADLRRSALGGVLEGRRNIFQKVDFTEADLRQTVYVSAEFVGCRFKDTRLSKVNFGGSSFTDCSFEGELREVCFNRKGFKADALPPNEMLRVDFSRAQLRSVEFRGLDLDNVRFPTDEDHLLLNDYLQTLDKLLEALRGRKDTTSKMLAGYFSVYRKWAGPRQRQGVLNQNDLLETVGEEGLRSVLEIIEPSRRFLLTGSTGRRGFRTSPACHDKRRSRGPLVWRGHRTRVVSRVPTMLLTRCDECFRRSD
jgi:uncharacterized protein YjbI with pentapeptide repeats